MKDSCFWGFVNTSLKYFLYGENIDDIILDSNYHTLTYNDTYHYMACGQDQIQFNFLDINEFILFLIEPRLINASKHFNLNLMRKGGTIYSKYHCFDLVDDIL